MSGNPHDDDTDPMEPGRGYSLSGRLMLSAIVMLFAVVVLMVCLHIYARWYLLQTRRRHLRRRTRTRTQLVFYTEPNNPNSATASRGLDAAVLSSIPIFLYSHGTHLELPECAVCLSEVEENEKIRILPKCNHGFHVECIDMWFHSHSTCPLCRSEVEPVLETRDFVVSVGEPGESETGSSSEFFVTCPQEESGTSSSLGDRRRGFELERVTIEVPKRYEPADELRLSSPSSHGLKSPASSRLMSFKRILSLNRKGMAVSPSAAAAAAGGVGTSRGVFDVECGRDESTQGQSRVQTPR